MADRVMTGKASIKGMMANSPAMTHAFMYPKGGGGIPNAKPVVKSTGSKGNANKAIKGNPQADNDQDVVGK